MIKNTIYIKINGEAMSSTEKKYINEIYDTHKKFIIIGLTGKTGSGCTTIADLFCKDFKDLLQIKPEQKEKSHLERKKDDIIYEYAKESWKPFKKITVSDLIASFIFEKEYEDFKSFAKSLDIEIKDSFSTKFASLKERYKKYEEFINHSDIRAKNKTIKTKDLENFYFYELHDFHNELKKSLERQKYAKLWQTIGTNIRSSGSYDSSEPDHKNFYKLSEKINTCIKILRGSYKKSKQRQEVRIVIDAFRNPFEVSFFRDRYSSFYLLSVTADEEIRYKRLFAQNYNKETIDNIDKVEKTKEDNDKKTNKENKSTYFVSQDIPRCVELSDIYIHNDEEKTKNLSSLSLKIIRYVSLMMHPGLVCPTDIERNMQIAYNAKVNSGCISRQVGAVVTDKYFSILSVGWNDVPRGQIPCNLRNINILTTNDNDNSFSNYENNNEEYKSFITSHIKDFRKNNSNFENLKIPYCFKDAYNALVEKKNQVHTRSLHAEENAFLQLAKNGTKLVENGILFTTASPCELCAKKTYQLGIKKVYYIDLYPGISEQHIIRHGEHEVEMIHFEGAIGRAYIMLYQNMIPYKDELEKCYGMKFTQKK